MIALENKKATARTAIGLSRAVNLIGCEQAAFEAVIKVESGSRGFIGCRRIR